MHIYQHLWGMNWQLSSRLPGFTAFKLRSSEALALSTSSRRIFAGLMSRWTTGGAKLAWKPKDLSPYGGTWDYEMERLEAYVCWVFVTGALFVLNFPQITRKKKKKTRWWLDGSWKRHLVKDNFKRRVHFGGRNYPVTWLAYKCYLLDHHHSFSIGNQDHDLTVHLSMLQSVAVNKLQSGDHVHTNFQ